jgi:hypothetical protein
MAIRDAVVTRLTEHARDFYYSLLPEVDEEDRSEKGLKLQEKRLEQISRMSNRELSRQVAWITAIRGMPAPWLLRILLGGGTFEEHFTMRGVLGSDTGGPMNKKTASHGAELERMKKEVASSRNAREGGWAYNIANNEEIRNGHQRFLDDLSPPKHALNKERTVLQPKTTGGRYKLPKVIPGVNLETKAPYPAAAAGSCCNKSLMLVWMLNDITTSAGGQKLGENLTTGEQRALDVRDIKRATVTALEDLAAHCRWYKNHVIVLGGSANAWSAPGAFDDMVVELRKHATALGLQTVTLAETWDCLKMRNCMDDSQYHLVGNGTTMTCLWEKFNQAS